MACQSSGSDIPHTRAENEDYPTGEQDQENMGSSVHNSVNILIKGKHQDIPLTRVFRNNVSVRGNSLLILLITIFR